MNNIKSFDEYSGYELEVVAYDNVLNEKKGIMGGGLRGFFNRRAAGKVRAELSDEIEMSKSIMEGIKEGLETLSENFDTIQKSLDNSDENDKKKGEKQKLLEDITKILENSKKSTWDLNELIDEGEIDYTGFTANVGIASVAYFGILLTPFRAGIMIHKGYNYFFSIVKNTVRKALVMLQLNFDQFENLVVTQSLRCAGVITATDASSEIDQFYGNLTAQIAENKSLSKRQLEKFNAVLKTAKDKFEQQRKSIKDQSTAETLYNNLDPYNNTYTKSLEALRQYSADDVQKHLDAIKTSMNKLAGQEVDLQTFSELIIAAAEEHAYEVSSSIYNKFAKMTEVFSLPNQQKLIDLILAANKEQKAAAKKIRDEKKASKELQEKIELKSKDAEEGLKVFKSLKGVEIEELEGGEVTEDAEVKKYDESKIKADNWTYEEFSKLGKDDQDSFDTWLNIHPEVLKKCDKSLQFYIKTNPKSVYFDSSYIDSLIDYIAPCISNDSSTEESGDESVTESVILSFDEYIFEAKKKKKKKHHSSSKSHIPEPEKTEETESSKYKLSDKEKEKLDKKIETVKAKLTDLMTLALGKDYLDKEEFTDEDKAKLDYIIEKSKEKEVDEGVIDELESYRKGIETRYDFFIDFKNIDNAQINDLKLLYDNEDVAVAALEAIGKKVLKDNTFVKNSKYIAGRIKKCLNKKKVGISVMSSILLANSINSLRELRNNDYVQVEKDTKKSEE